MFDFCNSLRNITTDMRSYLDHKSMGLYHWWPHILIQTSFNLAYLLNLKLDPTAVISYIHISMLSSGHFLLLYIFLSSSRFGRPSQSCVRGLLIVSSLALADEHENDKRNDRDKDRKERNLHEENHKNSNHDVREVGNAGDQDRGSSQYLNSVAEALGVAQLYENRDSGDDFREIPMKEQKVYIKHSSVLL